MFSFPLHYEPSIGGGISREASDAIVQRPVRLI